MYVGPEGESEFNSKNTEQIIISNASYLIFLSMCKKKLGDFHHHRLETLSGTICIALFYSSGAERLAWEGWG